MLVARCPKCNAKFRVSPDALNARQGQVRCGECLNVFNAFQTLAREPDPAPVRVDVASPIVPPAPPAPPDPPAPAATPRAVPAAAAAPPATPVAQSAAMPEAPRPIQSTAEQAAKPAHETMPPPVERADEPTHQEPIVPIDVPALLSVPPSHSTPASIEAERLADEILSGGERRTPRAAPLEVPHAVSRYGWAWLLGCALLVVLLALQAAIWHRAELALEWPQTRPWLEEACALLDCRVAWPNDKKQLDLVVDEFRGSGTARNQFSLTATLKHRGSQAMEYPDLIVVLTNNASQPIVRRRLAPTEYLGRALDRAELLAPGSEIIVKLTLASDQPAVSGYEMDVDYLR
jgi:predicted Zn finger-like uncharacterized protein